MDFRQHQHQHEHKGQSRTPSAPSFLHPLHPLHHSFVRQVPVPDGYGFPGVSEFWGRGDVILCHLLSFLVLHLHQPASSVRLVHLILATLHLDSSISRTLTLTPGLTPSGGGGGSGRTVPGTGRGRARGKVRGKVRSDAMGRARV